MNRLSRVVILSLILSCPMAASAATVSLHAQPTPVGVGGLVQVTLSLDSAVSVNAFSGILNFPSNLLIPVSVSDGSSIVSIWITHPATTTKNIAFAGITPGGFSGRGGTLFKVLFRTTAAVDATLSLTNVQILRNDGAGTNEPVTLVPVTISIAQESSATFVEAPDKAPPEPFVAYLGRSPQLFKNEYYLAFTAVDKNSGIDHYEVAETRWPLWLVTPVWRRVDSPYVIHDQYLTSDIFIKAFDRAGNERTSLFSRRNLIRPNEWLVLYIMLLVLAAFGFYRRRNIHS